MGFFSRLIFFFTVIVISASADVALIAGSELIGKMHSEATIVCRCSVESTQVLQRSTEMIGSKRRIRQTVMAVLYPEHLYKTDRTDLPNIEVVFEVPGPSLEQGQSNLLLFLKARGTEYVFVEPKAVFVMPEARSSSSADAGLSEIEDDLRTGALSADSTAVLKSLRILQCFDGFIKPTLSALRQLASGNDPKISLAAYAALLKAGEPEDVAAFARFEEHRKDGDPLILMGAGAALNRIRNPQDLASLESLSNSQSGAIKIGALEAIRGIGKASSIPALIEHLDDSDPTARYIAVITLSEITKKRGDYAPAMDVYEKDSGHYILEWKAWWIHEGRALYGRREIEGTGRTGRA